MLGAGGVLGGAWLTGGLHALAEETGWDPGSAEFVVGTSAGAMIGALTAAGVPPWFMRAHSAGETFDGVRSADGSPAAEADRAAGAVFRIHRGVPPIGPGSVRMALTALRNPLRHTPLQMMAGWLPAGFISTESLEQIVRRVVPGRWVDHPNFWAVTCDYVSGRRVPFGRLDAPNAEIAEAVAASCAIPGFYRPVKIGRRRYVDGGVCSASNLDLLAGRGLDLVICLNPLSGGAAGAVEDDDEPPSLAGVPLDPREWLGGLSRAANGRRLAHEAAKVRRFGTEVLVIEPTAGRPPCDGTQPDELGAPPGGHRHRRRDRARAAAPARDARPAAPPAAGRAAQDPPPRRTAVELARAAPRSPRGAIEGGLSVTPRPATARLA